MSSYSELLKKILIHFIRLYQIFISSFLGLRCRFEPTCSAYTLEALKQYGCMKGLTLGLRRILRCHPWHVGGYDPIPRKQVRDHMDVHHSD